MKNENRIHLLASQLSRTIGKSAKHTLSNFKIYQINEKWEALLKHYEPNHYEPNHYGPTSNEYIICVN